MLIVTLAISYLITFKLPWFMELTFHVPMQYCSLQHHTLLSPPDTFTTRHRFYFGSASSFFLQLFLHSFPVVYWTPTNLGDSSFSVISFCLFVQFSRSSQQVHWGGLPFPPPVDCTLSLSTMTCSSWVAWYDMVHSFIESHKFLHHDKAMIHEGMGGL